MTFPKLLEGHVDDAEDPRIAELEDEVASLRAELAKAKADLSLATRQSARAMGTLRRQLSPLYRALQDVFGELDAAGADEAAALPAGSGRQTAQWDEWKTRLGPSCAKVIDVLLLGGEMTVTAIMTTAKMGKNTVYAATSKMGQAGILVRNGSKFSLKQL